MFCYQCEETNRGTGCTIQGVCGKKGEVADLQDLLIHMTKIISYYSLEAKKQKINTKEYEQYIVDSLFSTITNANFDKQHFIKKINTALTLRDTLIKQLPKTPPFNDSNWIPKNDQDMLEKAQKIGILRTTNEDIRSLRELLTFGLKGMSAYYHHANILGYYDPTIIAFIQKGLIATIKDHTVDELTQLVLECGTIGVKTLALLDKANTTTYGHPEPTKVNIEAGINPGILISGHDLKDLEELLQQTQGTGVDIYTHGEMLPANAYPAFKKYDNFRGNYGNSWWLQRTEFEQFNGPILMTTNCLVPPKDSYKDRVYVTGIVGFEGLKHIPKRTGTGSKDFSQIITHAKTCDPPTPLEKGSITIGFAHHTLEGTAGKILDAVKSGKIENFVVMAGCDGRHKERDYYTQFAQSLPKTSVILTAGCAKYRYNKLALGDIADIPRVIDAGQCNDSYSLVVIAQKLAEALHVEIHDLPIIYNIAWYEQKAVLVLLALLSLGVKNIVLGPKLPAFLSPNVLNVLVEKFNIRPNTTVETDIPKLLQSLLTP
ncbi:MAG: hydroxylamine reductase [Candidatus Thermoplasmatota archaeon]|nr:hydroxylamine reductase [Candidatus Thermoplasmatota archaeon]MBU1940842.1 hydroxylamine reductase [Candidatus Thermoplasmatota archaeon]